VALDAENKLVLEVVNGKRTVTDTKRLGRNTARRLKNKPLRLITSDEYPPYKQAILESFGTKRQTRPTGKRGRPKQARYRPTPDLVYATVHKTRVKGRVKKVECRTVFGTEEQVKSALAVSRWSRKVNTSFIERYNGTDRNRCSRKVRKSYCFSKDWEVHRAATCLSMYSDNFCWAVRTLRRPDGLPGAYSPAMAAGLADHLWTLNEWLKIPICKLELITRKYFMPSPSAPRSHLHAKLDALLDECDLVADHSAFGQTFDNMENFFLVQGRQFLQETFQEKLQECVQRTETTAESKQCPHCKKKRNTKTIKQNA
jgi:IS1 family transposase